MKICFFGKINEKKRNIVTYPSSNGGMDQYVSVDVVFSTCERMC